MWLDGRPQGSHLQPGEGSHRAWLGAPCAGALHWCHLHESDGSCSYWAGLLQLLDEYIFMCVVGGKLCPKLSGSSLTLYAIWDQSCLFIVPWFPFLRKKYSWRCMNEWCGGWITPVSFQMSSEY